MLPPDDLTLAIDIQSRSYKLLRWVATAIEKGFIPATRAHEYADVAASAFDWIDQHYLNFPAETRPERRHLRQFANFFSRYVISSGSSLTQSEWVRSDPRLLRSQSLAACAALLLHCVYSFDEHRETRRV